MVKIKKVSCLLTLLLALNYNTVVANESYENNIGYDLLNTGGRGDDIDIIPFNQLLLPNILVVSNDGFWSRPFYTVGASQGTRLNFWYQNNTNNPVVVRIQRRIGNAWVNIGNAMNVAANSQEARQITSIVTLAEHRITVTNASGFPVSGIVSVRQTAQSLN